jgi:hypothetical protein
MKSKKAHRMKFGMGDIKEIKKEFHSELYRRFDKKVWDKIGGHDVGILKYAEFKGSEEYMKMLAAETIELRNEWESKGRRVDNLGLKPLGQLIEEKYFGVIY